MVYSMKSAYHLCVEDLIDMSHLQRPRYWYSIWNLKGPPKIKNLIWYICRGCLLTRVRLHDKGQQCSLGSVTCDTPFEDLNHVFLTISLLYRFDNIVVFGTLFIVRCSTQEQQPKLFFSSCMISQMIIHNVLPLFGVFGSTKTSSSCKMS